jgi:hypothetical protein
VPRATVIERGTTGRNKLVDVSGLSLADALNRLESAI